MRDSECTRVLLTEAARTVWPGIYTGRHMFGDMVLPPPEWGVRELFGAAWNVAKGSM